MRSNNALHTDRLLAHSLLILDIGNCEIGARRVGGSAELAGDNHALDSPRGELELERHAGRRAGVAGLEGVLIQETLRCRAG